MAIFKGDKLKAAALGNVVPQLHLHHIVRYQTDAAWPASVWGRVPPNPYSVSAAAERMAQLKQALSSAAMPLSPV